MRKTMIIRQLVAAMFLAVACNVMAQTGADASAPPYCQILDYPSDPVYRVSLGWISESRYTGYGKTTALEIDGDWNWAYFRDVAFGGDVDMSLRLRSSVFLNSAGLNLPDQLVQLALGAEWMFRGANGVAYQCGIWPGVFSDVEKLDADALYVPLSFGVVRSFDDRLSGIFGLTYRPGFETEIMPALGLAWAVNDYLRLEAGLPRSRLSWILDSDWTTHLAFEWRNASYRVRDEHDQVTLEDFRVSWGMTRRLSDELYMAGELGIMAERTVEFDEGPEGEVEVEKQVFAKFTVNGPF